MPRQDEVGQAVADAQAVQRDVMQEVGQDGVVEDDLAACRAEG
ncbi:hypothetical protein [Azoarcus sp. KH32C]|nr:hypothetical protein [Azoarcus sp. KH32C]